MLINSNGDKWNVKLPTVLHVPNRDDYAEDKLGDFERAYDNYLLSMMKQSKILRKTIACNTYGNFINPDTKQAESKRIHNESEPCFCCAHVVPQIDQDKPDGIVIHKGFYTCRTCRILLDSHRFNFQEEIRVMCHPCVEMAIRNVQTIDPSKVVVRTKL